MRAATPLPQQTEKRSPQRARLLLGSFLFFPACADQHAGDGVIALVASGIEDHVAVGGRSAHLDADGPGLGPGVGVFEGDVAAQRVGIEASEALSHLEAVGIGAAIGLLEIGGLDDQGIAFPAAARIAENKLDVGGKMRAAVDVDDAVASAGVIVFHV